MPNIKGYYMAYQNILFISLVLFIQAVFLFSGATWFWVMSPLIALSAYIVVIAAFCWWLFW